MIHAVSHAARRHLFGTIAFVAALGAIAVAAPAASAATFEVKNRQDQPDVTPGDGVCEAANGKCTMRAAFEEANALSSNDKIKARGGIYILDDGELLIEDNGSLKVRGDDQFGRTVAIDADGGSRVIDILEGASAKLFGISVTGGESRDGEGAGIRTGFGTETKLTRVRVNGNRSLFGGGGIANAGQLSVVRSDIETNSADGNGGGILSGPDFLQPPEARGLDVISVSLRNTRINNNDADLGGGGLYIGNGLLDVYRSTISGNTAGEFGGGILASPLRSLRGAEGGNGELAVHVELITSTVSSNKSGITGFEVGDGSGGGIMLFGGSELLAEHSTIADNTNNASEINTGAGLAMDGGESTIRNTIIAENRTNGEMDNCRASEGDIVSLGFNLENRAQCEFDEGSDFQNVNPQIGRLRLNPPSPTKPGGRGETHRIAASSPAHNGGPNNCGPQDQRAVPRPKGASCDIGSFERKKG